VLSAQGVPPQALECKVSSLLSEQLLQSTLCAAGSSEGGAGGKILPSKSMLKLSLGGPGRVVLSALLGAETMLAFSCVLCLSNGGADGSCIDKRAPEA